MRANIPFPRAPLLRVRMGLNHFDHDAFVGLEKPVYLCIHVFCRFFFFNYLVYGGGCLVGWLVWLRQAILLQLR